MTWQWNCRYDKYMTLQIWLSWPNQCYRAAKYKHQDAILWISRDWPQHHAYHLWGEKIASHSALCKHPKGGKYPTPFSVDWFPFSSLGVACVCLPSASQSVAFHCPASCGSSLHLAELNNWVKIRSTEANENKISKATMFGFSVNKPYLNIWSYTMDYDQHRYI